MLRRRTPRRLGQDARLAGALKVFLRNDRARAWLGDGFGLIALHRPELAGSGDDITISVDPVTGTHLKALWERLEALEDQAGPRDTSKPRRVAGYPDSRRPNGSPSPSQPWWDDHGSFTPALALYAALSGLGMLLIALWIRLRGSGFGGRRGRTAVVAADADRTKGRLADPPKPHAQHRHGIGED